MILVSDPYPIFDNFRSDSLHPDTQITDNLNIELMVVNNKPIIKLLPLHFHLHWFYSFFYQLLYVSAIVDRHLFEHVCEYCEKI